MTDLPQPNDLAKHEGFTTSKRHHILMITHGIHQWQVVPGLPDTGGQNVFVNQFTDTLVDMGYKVTIANRGGFPHPITKEKREGIDYLNECQRIIFTEDGDDSFVRKEDMHEHVPALTRFLHRLLSETKDWVDLIVSHYWDGALSGVLLNEMFEQPCKHLWVPHSLGSVKKRNMSPDTWEKLRIDERIAVEKEVVPKLDATAATSSVIRTALIDNYGAGDPLFLPPCVKADRYFPRKMDLEHEIYDLLAEKSGLPVEEVRQARIITEISRTDKTKRKNVLIEAFAEVLQSVPDAFLALTIDPSEEDLFTGLKTMIDQLGVKPRVAVLGNIWDQLPYLYAVTSVYCSPSVMEGFGMSVQEAAATSVPVVGSNLIPFVCEYLLGDDPHRVDVDDPQAEPLLVGAGGIVVQADQCAGFAAALKRLLQDEDERRNMGQRAYDITIPYFTWHKMVERCFESIDF